jgi:hypothetical protein
MKFDALKFLKLYLKIKKLGEEEKKHRFLDVMSEDPDVWGDRKEAEKKLNIIYEKIEEKLEDKENFHKAVKKSDLGTQVEMRLRTYAIENGLDPQEVIDQFSQKLNEIELDEEELDFKVDRFLSLQNMMGYFLKIDNLVDKASKAVHDTARKQDGSVNQSEHLKGFVFEDFLAESFNIDAELLGRDDVEAVVHKSNEANSVDVSIEVNGKTVEKYQFKTGKTEKHTHRNVKESNTTDQKYVGPKGHGNEEINEKIEHDGVESASVTPEELDDITEKAKDKNSSANGPSFRKKISSKTYLKRGLSNLFKSLLINAGIIGIKYSYKYLKSIFTDEEFTDEEKAELKEELMASTISISFYTSIALTIGLIINKLFPKIASKLGGFWLSIATISIVDTGRLIIKVAKGEIGVAEATTRIIENTVYLAAESYGAYLTGGAAAAGLAFLWPAAPAIVAFGVGIGAAFVGANLARKVVDFIANIFKPIIKEESTNMNKEYVKQEI